MVIEFSENARSVACIPNSSFSVIFTAFCLLSYFIFPTPKWVLFVLLYNLTRVTEYLGRITVKVEEKPLSGRH